MKFVDSIEISVRSGKGGAGTVSFRAAKNLPKLGPDGGDGGFGGDVYLRATSNITTLSKLYYKQLYSAQDGEKGGVNGRTGKSGEDLVIDVPIGTMVKDVDRDEWIGEVTYEDELLLLCKGGKKGIGNRRYVSSTHQIPEESSPGGEAIEINIQLELKLMADVGFAGFPNSGKSTLLSKITKATPRIADYPFTTLTPQLGVVDLAHENDNFFGESFVVADIPGLVEGASDGKGLGHEFLRHLERTKIIAYLIDPFSVEREDPVQGFINLKKELASFGDELHKKPFMIILTKNDIAPEEFDYDSLINDLKKYTDDIFIISSATGTGIVDLKRFLYATVQELKKEMQKLELKDQEKLLNKRSSISKPTLTEGYKVIVEKEDDYDF